MRKLIKILAVFLCSTLSVTAQYVNYNTEYSFGVHGGLIESKMAFYPYNPSQSYKQSYSGGIQFRAITERYFGTQIELNYVDRGWKEKSDVYSFEHQLTYLELPLMTHITFGNDYIHWFFNMGPCVSYLLNDKISGVDYEAFKKDQPQQHQSIENKLDYGIIGGTGLEYRTPIGPIQLEARYHFGLGDLFSNKSTAPVRTSRSTYLNFTIGYLFSFTKK